MEYIPEEFEEKIVQVNRVSKKTAGGNKIGFSVLVVVGDKKGRVGVGLGKAQSVQNAIKKGSTYARKHLINVPMVGTSIPHEIFVKRGAAKVLLKPAAKGTGVIAGGAVRAVVEAAGIRDILSKVLGTSNQASNVYATLEALRGLKKERVWARPTSGKEAREEAAVTRPVRKGSRVEKTAIKKPKETEKTILAKTRSRGK